METGPALTEPSTVVSPTCTLVGRETDERPRRLVDLDGRDGMNYQLHRTTRISVVDRDWDWISRIIKRVEGPYRLRLRSVFTRFKEELDHARGVDRRTGTGLDVSSQYRATSLSRLGWGYGEAGFDSLQRRSWTGKDCSKSK